MAGMEMGDCWSSLVRGGGSLDRGGGGGARGSGRLWELKLIALGDGLDEQGPRAVSADFRCLACITGCMAVPFTEIRNLEKDQV